MTHPAEQYLYANIPLSAHLGVTVTRVSDGEVVLSAPLGPNLNHEANAFGGSVSAIAILAGWTFLHGRLHGSAEARRIVIQRNQMEYLAPVRSDFTATCPAPDPGAWERFMDGLNRKKKARIELSVTIAAAGKRVAVFQGTYVAFATSLAVS